MVEIAKGALSSHNPSQTANAIVGIVVFVVGSMLVFAIGFILRRNAKMYKQNDQMFNLLVTRKPSDLERNPPLGLVDEFIEVAKEVRGHKDEFDKLRTDNLNNKQAFALQDDAIGKLTSTVSGLSDIVRSYDLTSSSDLHVHTEVGKTPD